MADGKVVFEIIGDNSGIQSVLNETTNKIKEAGSDWDEESGGAAGSIKDNLINAFKAVTASAAFLKITQMLYQLGMQSIDVASDLEEVQNVVDVTFGQAGAARIDAWAKNAQMQFGLTELQAKQFASTLGAMFKSSGMAGPEIEDMSMALAGLAADMASFYNLDFETAYNKIRAGITGEIEPLKQLGINMSQANLEAFAMAQGIETAWSDMSQAEQVLLRYQYIMQATADAQGDFARTSDGYANSQRRITTGIEALKAMVGEILLPIATEISNAIADFLEMLTTRPTDALTEATEEIGDAVGQATQAQGILGYMDALYAKYGEMATQTEEWASALEHLKTVFPEINEYINEQTGALEMTVEQLRAYVEQTKQAALEEARRNAVAKAAEAVVAAEQEYYTAEINRDMAQSQATEAMRQMYDIIKGFGSTMSWQEAQGMGMDRLAYIARQYNQEQNGPGNQATVDMEAQIAAIMEVYDTNTQAAQNFSSQMELAAAKVATANATYDIAVQAVSRMTEAAVAAAGALGSVGGSVNMNSGQYYNWYYGGHSHALGLDYVPFDNYFARLHEGEGILTAEENRVWQNFKNGGGGMDYDTLGNVMRDNVRAGGNVYLDGVTVGRVISGRQADSYRALERSGWQS